MDRFRARLQSRGIHDRDAGPEEPFTLSIPPHEQDAMGRPCVDQRPKSCGHSAIPDERGARARENLRGYRPVGDGNANFRW
jgi:hypothetical protein